MRERRVTFWGVRLESGTAKAPLGGARTRMNTETRRLQRGSATSRVRFVNSSVIGEGSAHRPKREKPQMNADPTTA
jgi:hypothetical protein